MNGITKRLLYLILLYSMCMLTINAYANQINKLFYHHISQDVVQDVELGKLVLYSTKNPMIQVLSHDQASSIAGYKQSVFLFPQATVSADEVQRISARLKQESKTPYHFTITSVQTPIPGVKVVFDYDPSKVSLSYDVFDSIQQQKGVEFRLYNQLILNRLKKNESCVLRTAHNKRIIIDCGHGGADAGASGCFDIKEKDITLTLGLQLAAALEKKGYDVFLTRAHDCDLLLDERTSRSNKVSDARLLVSLHANYSVQKCSNGIETFSLDSGLFKEMINPQGTIVHDVINKKHQQSKLLAQAIHGQVIKHAQIKNNTVADRKVKHKVAQILLGSRVPAALVEVGFISNEHEARLLKDIEYQQLLVQGLCLGIDNYCCL